MRPFMIMNIHHIANQLRAAGFPVRKVEEGDDMTDGEIEITKTVSIQVATDLSYMIVNKEPEPDCLEIGKSRPMTVKGCLAMLADLREALS